MRGVHETNLHHPFFQKKMYFCRVKQPWPISRCADGRQTYRKNVEQAFICGYSNLVNSIRPHGKASVNVHCHVYLLIQYTYGVGFGIAYPRSEGDTRAWVAGWARVLTPALFLCVLFDKMFFAGLGSPGKRWKLLWSRVNFQSCHAYFCVLLLPALKRQNQAVGMFQDILKKWPSIILFKVHC